MSIHFDYKYSANVPSGAIELLGGELNQYLAELRRVVETGSYAAKEASLLVPSDEYMLPAVELLLDKVYTKDLRYVFVIGIGGSSLGTKAMYDALASARDLAPHSLPRLIFIETIDEGELSVAKSIIKKAEHKNELLFLVISKSGNTTETIFNAEILLEEFANKFGRNASRVVVMSETGSALLTAAHEQQMHTLELPPTVGGRYSVFTPVGLLPLALMGLPAGDIKNAAEKMVQKSLHPDIALNAAALSALTQYYFYQEGISIHDTFLFSPALESLGKWYRQLLGESIGKSAIGNSELKVGITPTVTVGSTDLHSVGQLYLGGPKSRLTTFVSIKSDSNIILPEERVWPDIVPMVTGKSAANVLSAIESGTKTAYTEASLPYTSLVMESISTSDLAEFMQWKMCEVMMLGHLLRVNPFDQPHVENYKKVTKQILES